MVGKIDAAALLASQPALIEVARRCDPAQLEQYVRHLLASWCEPDLDAEEAAAQDRRFPQLRNRHDGSWRGLFDLPDAAMETLLTVLEPLARRDGDQDTRTAGQRPADADRGPARPPGPGSRRCGATRGSSGSCSTLMDR